MASEAFNARHARTIVTTLIIEKRTWVNQISSWEKVCLCRAGYMSVNQRRTRENKAIYGCPALYLWTEAGRQFLDDVRKELLAQEAA